MYICFWCLCIYNYVSGVGVYNHVSGVGVYMLLVRGGGGMNVFDVRLLY